MTVLLHLWRASKARPLSISRTLNPRIYRHFHDASPHLSTSLLPLCPTSTFSFSSLSPLPPSPTKKRNVLMPINAPIVSITVHSLCYLSSPEPPPFISSFTSCPENSSSFARDPLQGEFGTHDPDRDSGHPLQHPPPPPRIERCPVALGDSWSLRRVFGIADVESFARVGGDFNPIHLDPVAASEAGFDSPVVHGILCAGLFPTVIANHFPGAIYVSQTLRFKAPVKIGEGVEVTVQVSSASAHRTKYYKVEFITQCYKLDPSNGVRSKLAIDGSAVALIPAHT